MKIKTHMPSAEIIKMFGEPEDIRTGTCGKAHGQAWSCTMWEYGEYGSGSASFTFYNKDGNLYLNSYDIDR